MAAEPEANVIESTALEVVRPYSPLVMPAVDEAGMRRAMQAYTAICEAVLDPSDYQTVGQKTFKKRSAWQKLATAFAVSTEVVDKTVHVDEKGAVVRAEFVVRATAPNGRHEDGYGAASLRERSFTKPDHDIPATAETRARNRACANLFAFGEMSAEEIDAPAAPPTRPPAAPAQPAPAAPVEPKAIARGRTVTIRRETPPAESEPPAGALDVAGLRAACYQAATTVKLAQAKKRHPDQKTNPDQLAAQVQDSLDKVSQSTWQQNFGDLAEAELGELLATLQQWVTDLGQ